MGECQKPYQFLTLSAETNSYNPFERQLWFFNVKYFMEESSATPGKEISLKSIQRLIHGWKMVLVTAVNGGFSNVHQQKCYMHMVIPMERKVRLINSIIQIHIITIK